MYMYLRVAKTVRHVRRDRYCVVSQLLSDTAAPVMSKIQTVCVKLVAVVPFE